jgi:triosephosphate isomerase
VDYVLVNWKMFPAVDEALVLFGAIKAGLRERAQAGARLPRVIICPPFVSLALVRAVVDDAVVGLGAQNCHWEQRGPYTGEISVGMLRDLVDYVMLGHSERRAAGESDEEIAKKVSAVAEAALVPILFVGEDDQSEDAIRQTEQRLRQGLSAVDPERHSVLVVYEPTWAVGAEQAAPIEHVRRSVEHLKRVLTELGVSRPAILYGGTVSEDNLEQFLGLDVLDGWGATRASLDAERFLRMIDKTTAAA